MDLIEHKAGYFYHPTAVIDAGALIEEGTKIWHWVHVSSGAKIGRNCSLGQGVYIGNDVSIGNSVKIQNNVSVYDSVILEDEVFCGPSMVFTNVNNPRSAIDRKKEYKSTIVRKGASIGANATIVCGNEIGENAFIAAGAVVTKQVESFSLVAGVPAKHQYWISSAGYRIEMQGSEGLCNETGERFLLKNNQLERA